MPRQARLDYPGAYHHVMGRGIDGLHIFKEKLDKEDFLCRIKRLQKKFSLSIYAWCVMENHFHFLYQTGRTSLAEFMRALLTGYAIRFNMRHKRRGYLFQNRYKSIIIEADEYFKPLLRYIHLNPVKAKIVQAEKLSGYKWSGHHEIMAMKKASVIERDKVLGYFDKRKKIAVKRYEEYLREGLQQNDDYLLGGGLIRSLGGWAEAAKITVKDREMGDERILGSGGFVEDVLETCEKEEKAIFTSTDDLLGRISRIYGVEKETILETKIKEVREARSMFVYFAVKLLNLSVKDAGKIIKIKNAAASLAMYRGMRVEEEKGILMKLNN